MLTSKQDIIDAYGHFFVLCGRHHEREPDPEGGYLSRVFNEIEKYNWVGSLDHGWEPKPPKQLEILEFFGEPRKGTEIGGPLGKLNWQNTYRSLEDAEAQADKIRAENAKMYEELREIGKTRELPFDTSTPDMPTVYVLQPDELEFPALLTNGSKLYGFVKYVEAPLSVFEVDVQAAKLSPHKQNASNEPFHYNYGLEISAAIPDPEREDEFFALDDTLYMKESTGDQWRQAQINKHAPYGMSNIVLALTKERAEERIKEYAADTYKNIRHLLPDVQPETPENTAQPVPSGP